MESINFPKFRNQVKINNEYLKKIENFIKNKERKFEFYLYEILFDVEKVNDLDKEYNKIISTINKENFNIAANEHSISNSSKFGGEIGWVKETQLSNDIFNIVKNLNTNEISKPFRTPGGYLILMFDKKKDLEKLFDKKKELENLKKYERNRQLNQYSLIYYKRLKKNSTIMSIDKVLVVLGEPNSIFSKYWQNFFIQKNLNYLKNYYNW